MPLTARNLPADATSAGHSITPESEQVDVTVEPAVVVPDVATFAELKLSAPVLEAIVVAGYTKPTPIQAQFIPLALTGRDVMGQAKTGTGKTASFLLPIFEKIKAGTSLSPQALVLAPTRELAMQIHSEVGRLGTKLGFSSITLYGGASYEPQIEALSHGVDIVVGTPGRVMDHMRSHRLDLSGIKIAVLDEADRMLDLGFRKDIEYILKHCPSSRQTLLLSATIAPDIKKLANRFMQDPLEVWTAPESLTVDKVEQHFFVCNHDEKLPILLKLLDVENPALAIIFCGTKIGAKKLAAKLKRLYINAREIHGDLQQARREKIMGRFRAGEVRLLIATDVASRGIDVQNITHIINYDIPYKIEDYVHRIGRTGRMERSGKAYTLVTREEGSYLTEIELLINREIIRAHFDDLTSKYWPVPPSGPTAEFLPDDAQESDYLPPSAEDSKRKGKSAGPSRGRRERSSSPSSSSRPPRQSNSAAPARAAVEHAGADPVASVGGEQAAPEAGVSEAGGEQPEKRSRRRNRRSGGSREPVTIVCSQCGAQSTVNFKPQSDRPVYCDSCYKLRKAPVREVTEVSGENPAAE